MKVPEWEELMEFINWDIDKNEIKSNMDQSFSGFLLTILESAEYEITLSGNGELKEYIVPAINCSELTTFLFSRGESISEDIAYEFGLDNDEEKSFIPIDTLMEITNTEESFIPTENAVQIINTGETFKPIDTTTKITLKNTGFVVVYQKDYWGKWEEMRVKK